MRSKVRILIIDNNPEYLELVERTVDSAELGELFVKKMQQVSETEVELALSSGEYDVVFLDYETTAKFCNGYVASWLENVRDRNSRTSTVIISGKGDELLAVLMMRAGASDYIPKRLISSRLIRNAVNRALQDLNSSIRQNTRKKPETAPPKQAPAPEKDRRSITNKAKFFSGRDTVARALPKKFEIEIEGYKILRALNKSADADLFLASSEELGERVVLKIIKINLDDGEILPRFKREYEVVSKINHPLVVDIYDFGQVKDYAFIAMEYFPCGDLKNRMANPISAEQSVIYLKQIGKALSQLHSKSIVHRDLKPPNVMLREDNSIALIDFGLARTAESADITKVGQITGTPYYMSPEQILSRPIDIRSDIYSLGVIFFEMLTGKKPFLGKTAFEIIDGHVKSPVPTLPVELVNYQSLIDRMMAKEPDERFENTEQMIASLPSTTAVLEQLNEASAKTT